MKAASFTLDSNEIAVKITRIDNLNDDYSPDTLICVSRDGVNFYPKYITWGGDTVVHPDTTVYHKKAQTLITYPNWSNLQIQYGVDYINFDTRLDIYYILSGRIYQDSVNYTDTSEIVCVFGQCGLDTNSIINVANITPFQYFPFIAMHIPKDAWLSNCVARGNYGLNSYQVNKINVVILPPPPKLHAKSDPEVHANNVEIFPNPARDEFKIRLQGFDAGLYNVQILDINFRLIQSFDIDIKDRKSIQEEVIQSNTIPSGIYFIKLISGEKMYPVYTVTVVH